MKKCDQIRIVWNSWFYLSEELLTFRHSSCFPSLSISPSLNILYISAIVKVYTVQCQTVKLKLTNEIPHTAFWKCSSKFDGMDEWVKARRRERQREKEKENKSNEYKKSIVL